MGLNPVPKVFCGSSLGLILNNIVSILVVLVGVTYNFLGWYGLDPLKKASLSPPYFYMEVLKKTALIEIRFQDNNLVAKYG